MHKILQRGGLRSVLDLLVLACKRRLLNFQEFCELVVKRSHY